MSRIRGFEAKIQKELLQTHRNGWDENCEKKSEGQSCYTKDDAEKQQIAELVSKLPRLDKIFTVHRKIGEGTFSSVYLGSLRAHSPLPDASKRWFAIKHLVPTAHPARIEHELRCLRDIGGKNNVIGVDLCLRNLDTIVFVMPYIPHRKFSEYVGEMDAVELAAYMRALLIALRHVHSFGVIHRDVKPSNFLYDRENRRLGLHGSSFLSYTIREVASKRLYRAHEPPAPQTLADLLGTGPLQRAAEALGRRLVTSSPRRGLCLRKLCARLRGPPPPAAPGAKACALCRLPRPHCLCRDEAVPAAEWREGAGVAGFPDCAFALAARLLEPDPRRRPSAAQALAHPFLAEARP
ncbi:3-phosphoinositide-dependent protein kinase 1-like [Hyposmocoma kahamanoa]|uniref:3-phosphoinositide-dependent protein kinase 1-like n=1 Tax=Hyposmocoma kahamanoa TaxID=1477025 RepID=UPI000E6D99FE|nr:3-phosphoinositide-dependent protein kinase 1-like [Hyposmocoma kahamanoa]